MRQLRPRPHQRHQVRPVDCPPSLLGGLQQLEHHRQPGLLAARALGDRVLVRTGEKVDSRLLCQAAAGVAGLATVSNRWAWSATCGG
jgi:hypothetical protein